MVVDCYDPHELWDPPEKYTRLYDPDGYEGGEPEERPHFTLGYGEYVWTRDESYVMVSRNDGKEARLYDLRADPSMDNDLAGEQPDVVRQMFEEYVLKDAGGPLPRY